MAILALASIALTNVFELAGHGTVPQAVGAALEGKEVRFDVSELGHVRGGHHAHLDRRGQLVPRLVHRAGRR